MSETLVERAEEFTDAGPWKASWHWKRDGSGRITFYGMQQILRDLGCGGDIGEEIAVAIEKIRKRYALAVDVRAEIARMEEAAKEVSDG